METQERKCVIVLDEALPTGVLANTAAILGITMGQRLPELVGPDVADASGREHLGITAFPVPVLRADQEQIRSIRERLYEPAFAEVTAVDFSDVAQGCMVYEDYQAKAAETAEEAMRYYGVGLCGGKKLVNKLTGSLPLLR